MQSFYWCAGPSQSEMFYKHCSEGLRFNEAISNCDWAANVPCAGAPTGPAPNGPAPSGPTRPPSAYTGELSLLL
jgi:hypothetical protein